MIEKSQMAQKGQSLVEFALAIPILLLLFVVIFDLGRAVYYSSVVHNAAREGARYGIIYPDDISGMEDAARAYAVGLGLTDLSVFAELGPPETVGGINNPTVHVNVDYSFSPATPLVEVFLPEDPLCGCKRIHLIGDALMRTEALPETP
jgi:Flp pilus assembly protein TadG